MNKTVYILVAGLLIVPGCFKKAKREFGTGRSTYEKAGIRSIFDEDVESFILEENHNPFAPQSGDSVRLIESSDLWDAHERRGELETIYFDFDKHDIRPDQKGALDRTLVKIKKIASKEGATIVLEGHACTFGGSAQYNMRLSEQRAEAIRHYLIKHGIPAHQLKTVGHGSEQCKTQGGNQEQQAPNRRVEFVEIETTE